MAKCPPIVGSRTSSEFTVFLKNKSYTVNSKDRRFHLFFDTLRDNKDSENLEDLLCEVLNSTPEKVITKESNGLLEFKNGAVYYDGKELHSVIAEKIQELYNDGLPYDGLFSFLEKLMSNPDSQCVERLYLYLERNGLPIINEGEHVGCFISYKKVGPQFQSAHRDVDGSLVYSRPGDTVRMRRNAVDSRHEVGCSYGLHVGSISYVRNFSVTGSDDKVIACAVNPANVVTVPYEDCNKLRCSEYTVLYEMDEPEALAGKLYTSFGSEIKGSTYDVEADWDDLADELEDFDSYDEYDEDYDDEYEEDYDDDVVETEQRKCCKGNNSGCYHNLRDDKGRFRKI